LASGEPDVSGGRREEEEGMGMEEGGVEEEGKEKEEKEAVRKSTSKVCSLTVAFLELRL